MRSRGRVISGTEVGGLVVRGRINEVSNKNMSMMGVFENVMYVKASLIFDIKVAAVGVIHPLHQPWF